MGGAISCAVGTISCAGGAGYCTGEVGGISGGGLGAGGLPSAMSTYITDHTTNVFNSNPNINLVDSDCQ